MLLFWTMEFQEKMLLRFTDLYYWSQVSVVHAPPGRFCIWSYMSFSVKFSNFFLKCTTPSMRRAFEVLFRLQNHELLWKAQEKIPLLKPCLIVWSYSWTSSYWTARLSFFSYKWPIWGLLLGTQITPQGWLFWTMIFYNLKKFTLKSI